MKLPYLMIFIEGTVPDTCGVRSYLSVLYLTVALSHATRASADYSMHKLVHTERCIWTSQHLPSTTSERCSNMPIKALSFKGDKKPAKKRKRPTEDTHRAAAVIQDGAVDEDAWVSAESVDDIAGPVLLILPTTRPVACISVDQLGSVFTQKVENMVEGDAATAEPHDVRQVWVATRVVGSADAFTLKGSNTR